MKLTNQFTRWLLSLLLCLNVVASARGEGRLVDTPGQQRYMRVEKDSTHYFAVQMTERGTGGDSVYVVTDAQIVTAASNAGISLPAGTYSVTYRPGTASASAADLPRSASQLNWTGTAEIDYAKEAHALLTNVTYGLEALLDAIESIEGGGGGGGGTAAQIINEEIVPELVFKFGRRRDGDTLVIGPCYLRKGEITPVWIDPSTMTGGRWLSNVTNVASTDEDELTITDHGVNRELGVLIIDTTDTTEGETYYVTCDLVPKGSRALKAKLEVVITADEEED